MQGTIFIGISQIFLQQNAYAGFLISVAMFISHWSLGIACILGSLIGTITATLGKYERRLIQQGLYGFNASLSFMCVVFTFSTALHKPIVWLIGIFAAIFATLIMHQFVRQQKTAFTFPFIASSYLCCFAVAHYSLFGLKAAPLPSTSAEPLLLPFYAWAEVNFSNNWLSGVLIFIAIALTSPTVAIWGTAAACISAVISHKIFPIDTQTIAQGLYSYSALLVGCAFAGRFIAVMSGIILAIIGQYLLNQLSIPPYTLGFVFACWVLLWWQKIYQHNSFV